MEGSSSSDRRKGMWPQGRWIIGVVAVAVGVLLLLFQWREARPVLPERLSTYALVQAAHGDDARQTVNRLHFSAVAPRDNAIGEYRDGNRAAVVYVSMYDDERVAALQYEQMRDRMSATPSPFKDLAEYSAGTIRYSTCTGNGQQHYFFACERRLVWIAVDVQDAVRVFESYCSLAVNQ